MIKLKFIRITHCFLQKNKTQNNTKTHKTYLKTQNIHLKTA